MYTRSCSYLELSIKSRQWVLFKKGDHWVPSHLAGQDLRSVASIYVQIFTTHRWHQVNIYIFTCVPRYMYSIYKTATTQDKYM